MIKIAVLGLGSHAIKNTLPALQASDSFELVGAFTRDSAKLNDVSAEYGFKAWESADAMLTDHDIDAIYIATPVGVHYQQVKLALANSKHVFCEKTLTENVAKTTELFDLAQQQDVLLAECIMYVYHRQFAKARSMINEGELGTLHSVYARFGFPHLSPDNIRYNKNLGGGALLDAGLYPISVMVELFDHAWDAFDGHLFHSDEYAVDIRGSFLACKNNVSFHGEWGMGMDYSNEIEFWGSNGKLTLQRAFSKPPELQTNLVTIKNGSENQDTIPADNHFINMFEDFAEAIESEDKRQRLRGRSLAVARAMAHLQQ